MAIRLKEEDILVTGGHGFLGRFVTHKLKARGCRSEILSNNPMTEKAIEWCKSNLVKIRPDEMYNLAAQSFVKASFDQPILTSDMDGSKSQ